MPAAEPSWWYGKEGAWKAALLSPVAKIYAAIASRRILNAQPYRASLPVICVGNFTAGGSGKTPLSLFIGKLLAAEGREPWFLSRGYGGRLEGPVRVDPARHSAAEVGDEPLLLARAHPTVISRDRSEGAKAIESIAPKSAVIIMDDGLQNPALRKDLSIAVVDAKRGFGNGQVIPAGPLRAPLVLQAKLVQLIVLISNDQNTTPPVLNAITAYTAAPIVTAQTRADPSAIRFRNRPILAYAGIANPERFFSMLKALGADVLAEQAFADHHAFSEEEARALLDKANRLNATLVTTEKDLARLGGLSGSCRELQTRSETLAISTVVAPDGLEVLRSAIARSIERPLA
ncbi:tetraacyldisaccharide 4'-kinase [Hyphomicrobium sp.]|uniref:tetraacyldisaccharide 4'-kinase n=1 Tax=Hyphomicrobium sp. TaxID=82 RepID=UPI000FB03C89|nr:tetraacyldisaccharide 4'-kinase [Hyphomicrobium sp.]RUO99886.1 MAG: tetraacyldisaccharide 4'-kinase [Hyphomicrobium sp.]